MEWLLALEIYVRIYGDFRHLERKLGGIGGMPRRLLKSLTGISSFSFSIFVCN